MPSSRIPGERVALNDSATGIINKSWYRFFNDLFVLTGGGATVDALDDLQGLVETAPPAAASTGPAIIGNVSATLNFPSTAANSSSVLTVTVPGAVDGDIVNLAVQNVSVPTQGAYFAWVSAANTVTVRFLNNTVAAVDPASGVFKVIVERY